MRWAPSHWVRQQGQRIARSPLWRVGRFVIIGVGFLLAWTGWTGPELLDRLGGEFLQSDAFRTILVVLGFLLVLAVVLVPAPFRPSDWVVTYDGKLVPRRQTAPGYEARCEWNESRWWLTLDRPSDENARFIVTVRHETGAAVHDEFWQADRTIVITYPDNFEASSMPSRKPWGEYMVTWDVYTAGGGHDVIESKFTWRPFQGLA